MGGRCLQGSILGKEDHLGEEGRLDLPSSGTKHVGESERGGDAGRCSAGDEGEAQLRCQVLHIWWPEVSVKVVLVAAVRTTSQ